MNKPHTITVEEVNEALKAKHRVLLCSSVGGKVSKHFTVVITPTDLNPYTFEVDAIVNGVKMNWYSNEPESMVQRYNELG